MTVRLFVYVWAIFLFLAGGLAAGQVALTIVPIGGAAGIEISLQDLQAFDQKTLVTANDFVDGEKTFRGPLLRVVLDSLNISLGPSVILTAANDFQVEVQTSEYYDYDVILALEMDGTALSARDKGPTIWVIYPMSDFTGLRDPVYNSRLIWQLVRIELQ